MSRLHEYGLVAGIVLIGGYVLKKGLGSFKMPFSDVKMPDIDITMPNIDIAMSDITMPDILTNVDVKPPSIENIFQVPLPVVQADVPDKYTDEGIRDRLQMIWDKIGGAPPINIDIDVAGGYSDVLMHPGSTDPGNTWNINLPDYVTPVVPTPVAPVVDDTPFTEEDALSIITPPRGVDVIEEILSEGGRGGGDGYYTNDPDYVTPVVPTPVAPVVDDTPFTEEDALSIITPPRGVDVIEEILSGGGGGGGDGYYTNDPNNDTYFTSLSGVTDEGQADSIWGDDFGV